MSIGIKIQVIGASYPPHGFTHCYLAALDEKGQWLKFDATTADGKVGSVKKPEREMWIDPDPARNK